MEATFSVVRCSREFTMEMPARISGNAVNGVSHRLLWYYPYEEIHVFRKDHP
jgi:hypothetical protein